MRLVVDASILVAELVRQRGQEVIMHPLLDLFVAEHAWGETQHEVARRLQAMERHGHITTEERQEILAATQSLVALRLRFLPSYVYDSWEDEARERIPRDPHDWPTVATALVLDAAIWTHDNDFLGCGIATWTTETLVAHLRRHDTHSASTEP